jgi:DNA-binding XRE family transcriptional regulator
MNQAKRKKLEAKGWKIGSTAEFLDLTAEESAYIGLKVALADFLQARRKEQDLTQAGFAKRLHSSQSRVAKMEKGDPSVSLDLLIRSLYALGVDNSEMASVVAESTPGYDVKSSAKKKR